MPGIFGLACSSPLDDLASRLAAMATRQRHHDWYAEQTHADESGRVALGRVTTGFVNAAEQPAANETGTLLAVMEGEVYDYAEQRRALEAAGHRFATDSHAELLLHGFEEQAAAFFRGLHGKFAAAIWDATSRKLHLVNDRFGMKPLHYAHAAGRLTFGSEIKALLTDPAVNRRTDLRGVAQFFTFGQMLGETTLFDGVRLLPAAGWLTYDANTNRVTLDRYWRLRGLAVPGRSKAECLDRIDAAFTASVRRMTDDTDGLGLSLSGGLDARTLLGVIGPGKPLTSLSLGMPGSMDHRSAAEMARLLGYRHTQVVLGDEFLADYESHLRQMVRLTDGQYLCQCIVMPTLPVYRELGVRVLLRGHAGELMHMTKAYNFSLDDAALALRDEAGLYDWLWRRMQSFMLDGTEGRLFAPAHRTAMEGLARDSLRDCLRQTEGTEPVPHRIWQMFFEQRSRRETALSLAEFESVVETRLPYLDNELVDELFAAPPELKLRDEIQAHILKRHRPAFLNVVNVNTGTRVGASRLAKFVAKARLKVFAKLGVPGYQPYERLGLWLRRELKPLVRRLLLSDRALSRGVFDPMAVRSAVEDHLNHRNNHTYLLLAMMVFETSQREFVDGEAAPVEVAAV
ncbi:MAG: asparagine synthase-related protein [Gemmataceae bacterium]